MKICKLLLPVLGCLSMSAHAVPVTYRFSAIYFPPSESERSLSSGISSPPASPLFASTDVVTGTFVYDSEIPLSFTADGASIYESAITQLQLNIAGRTATDPMGIAVTIPDNIPGPAPIDDVLEFLADPRIETSGVDSMRDISGFTIGDWTLRNVRVFWANFLLSGDNPDLLLTDALPSVLPPSGFLPGESRVALDFIDATGDRVRTSFFDNLSVAPVSVPEPASFALMSLGMFIGAALRRRKQA